MADFDILDSEPYGNSGGDAGASSCTFPSTPAAGSLLIFLAAQRGVPSSGQNVPTGWTVLATFDAASLDSRSVTILGRIATGSETGITFSNVVPGGNAAPESGIYLELDYSGTGLPNVIDSAVAEFTNDTTPTFPTIAAPPGPDIWSLAFQWKNPATPDPGPQTLTGWTVADDTQFAMFGNRHRLTAWYQASAPGAIGGGTLSAATDGTEDGIVGVIAFEGASLAPPVGILPEYVEPAPAEALLEIWTSEPGSAEWGSAQWGVDTWGVAGWQDITDIGVSVDIRWGTTNPDAGILADQAAADWSVELFDPDRKVDPANPDSPYYPDIVPGLPIRLSHRGVVVHTGQAETIIRRYSEGMASIRATDNIAMMSRAKVPEDVTLADTMKARAREAIAAGGLDIATPSNPNDYAIPAQVPGDRSVWYWVSEAARDRHVIAYIDRDNALRWRAYSVPLRRGRVISDPELVDLQVRADDADRLSVVACLDEDGVTVEERALTPTPRWGKRRYSRDIPTTDADSWAAAVLADRAQSALRWQPGEIRPLTADAVESLATLEVNEEVRLESSTSGAAFYARVLGGRIRVTHDGTAPRWAFRLELTQSQSIYLVSDQDGSPLVSDTDTDEYLEAG